MRDPKDVHFQYVDSTIGYGNVRSYSSLKSKTLKIDEYDLLASVENDSIKEFHRMLPYGFVSGKLYGEDSARISVAIINKVDFINANRASREFPIDSYDHFLTYKPKKFMAKMFPQFEFAIYGSGDFPLNPLLELYGL